MAMTYLKIEFDDEPMVDMLSDAELGRLFRAVFKYAKCGEDEAPQGRENLIYQMLKVKVDRQRNSYNVKVDNGKKGGRPKTEENLTEPNETKPNLTKPNETKDNLTEPNETKDNLTEPNETKPNLLLNYNKSNQIISNQVKSNQVISSQIKSTNVSDDSTEVSDLTSVISIPLVDGTTHPVTQDDIDHYSELYPAVDIMAEIRKMVGWCEANPKRRKTKSGAKSFVANWLSKAQDRGGSSGTISQPQYQKRDISHFESERSYAGYTGMDEDGLSFAQKELLKTFSEEERKEMGFT